MPSGDRSRVRFPATPWRPSGGRTARPTRAFQYSTVSSPPKSASTIRVGAMMTRLAQLPGERRIVGGDSQVLSARCNRTRSAKSGTATQQACGERERDKRCARDTVRWITGVLRQVAALFEPESCWWCVRGTTPSKPRREASIEAGRRIRPTRGSGQHTTVDSRERVMQLVAPVGPVAQPRATSTPERPLDTYLTDLRGVARGLESAAGLHRIAIAPADLGRGPASCCCQARMRSKTRTQHPAHDVLTLV